MSLWAVVGFVFSRLLRDAQYVLQSTILGHTYADRLSNASKVEHQCVSPVILARISCPEYAVDSVFVFRPSHSVQNSHWQTFDTTQVALGGLKARQAS
jgi:hypothetical protein